MSDILNPVRTFSFINSMRQNIQPSLVFVTSCGGICTAHLWPSVFGRTRSSWGYQVAHSSSSLPYLFSIIITFSHHLHCNLNYTCNLPVSPPVLHPKWFSKHNRSKNLIKTHHGHPGPLHYSCVFPRHSQNGWIIALIFKMQSKKWATLLLKIPVNPQYCCWARVFVHQNNQRNSNTKWT